MIARLRAVDNRSWVAWMLRATWALVAVAAGPAFAEALDGRSAPVQRTVSAGLWAVWALTLVAALVPRPATLTVVRVVVPAGLAAAIVAAAVGAASPLALGATGLAAVLALTPAVGHVAVNGASYGDERRHLLRPPGPVLAGPIVLAWATLVAGVAAGPLLLAARQWIAGAIALAVGLPVAAAMAQALHRLSRRWLVFVPAGVVLHDGFAVLDPVLFRRNRIARLGPAPADTDALDLTQGAPGLALELDLTEPVEAVLVRPGRRREGETAALTRFLFTPTRPRWVLADARPRRIPTG